MPTVGSLFTGYDGIGLALTTLFPDATTIWCSDIDPGACKIIKKRLPGVPNLGDVANIDWRNVARPDILTGGFPCQDVSAAGLKKGLAAGTRSGLWGVMAEAIYQLQPALVIIENVAGLRSTISARTDVESCPICMGDADDAHMRAFGTVLEDLAGIGFDADWTSVTAASVGAPHKRERVFIAAYPSGKPWRGVDREYTPAAGGVHSALLPTPQASHARRGLSAASPGNSPTPATALGKLLPTPTATDHKRRSPGSPGNRETPADALGKLLPTPKASDADFAFPRTSGRPPEKSTHLATRLKYTDFGEYAEALARWETVIGRATPEVWDRTVNGNPQMAPKFIEWMMGLPDGWVTDTGISITAQTKALGNGVVPQQAAAAIQQLISMGLATDRSCA